MVMNWHHTERCAVRSRIRSSVISSRQSEDILYGGVGSAPDVSSKGSPSGDLSLAADDVEPFRVICRTILMY